MQNISQEKVKGLEFILPPVNEQHLIIEHIEEKTAVINTTIERTQREIDLIEEYRTTLIAHAVTGKIDTRPGALHAQRALHHPHQEDT